MTTQLVLNHYQDWFCLAAQAIHGCCIQMPQQVGINPKAFQMQTWQCAS
ncbi:MAG: hypothetical protein MJA27_23045 [Pseudanabaenales cyanobacterium]|nr:hypothetical protein [Pseudanabaenales cyanobacterium]